MSALADRQAELIDPMTVLWPVLIEHPTLLTEADLVRHIASDPPTFLERDRIEIGVRKLLSVGVLRREGDSLVPTPATLFLDDSLGI